MKIIRIIIFSILEYTCREWYEKILCCQDERIKCWAMDALWYDIYISTHPLLGCWLRVWETRPSRCYRVQGMTGTNLRQPSPHQPSFGSEFPLSPTPGFFPYLNRTRVPPLSSPFRFGPFFKGSSFFPEHASLQPLSRATNFISQLKNKIKKLD